MKKYIFQFFNLSNSYLSYVLPTNSKLDILNKVNFIFGYNWSVTQYAEVFLSSSFIE